MQGLNDKLHAKYLNWKEVKRKKVDGSVLRLSVAIDPTDGASVSI